MSLSERSRNLDLIRAAAITMVVIYHVFQQSVISSRGVLAITSYGQYGVDLFFVLSGWLIGGLYWRERRAFGDVLIVGFWIRRWMRTIPPYLVALIISWLAVYLARGQQFDLGYLLFIQNYYGKLPYFSVSWSLCVEEHFYLVIPIAFMAAQGLLGKKFIPELIIGLILVSPLVRLLAHIDPEETFGYWQTATHLRMEGLLFGFLLSYLSIEAPSRFQSVSRASPYIASVAGACLVLLVLIGGDVQYALWGTVVASFFAAALVYFVNRRPIGSQIARVVQPVAAASYSIYLTHAWVIYFAAELIKRAPGEISAVYFLLAPLGIAITGACFYWAVERSAIRVRDVTWPRRVGSNTQNARYASPIPKTDFPAGSQIRPTARMEPREELPR
jgi:peptidoglycan/LPS O-acetylase OafA/YrhL